MAAFEVARSKEWRNVLPSIDDDIATAQIAQGAAPRHKALREFLRVQARQNPSEGLMTGNAMRQLPQLSEPLGLDLAVFLDVFPSVSSTNHCTNGNNEHIDQRVALMRSMRAAGIG